MVVFEMIRPICASFPRCIPPAPSRARSGKPARIPHHRKQRGTVEALLNATFRGKDEVGDGEGAAGCREEAREGPRVFAFAFATRRMEREEDRDR